MWSQWKCEKKIWQSAGFLRREYLVAELADAGAGVEDEAASLFRDHLDAGGIAPDGREEVIRQGREEKLARFLALDVLGRDPLDRRGDLALDLRRHQRRRDRAPNSPKSYPHPSTPDRRRSSGRSSRPRAAQAGVLRYMPSIAAPPCRCRGRMRPRLRQEVPRIHDRGPERIGRALHGPILVDWHPPSPQNTQS